MCLDITAEIKKKTHTKKKKKKQKKKNEKKTQVFFWSKIVYYILREINIAFLQVVIISLAKVFQDCWSHVRMSAL